MKGSSLIKLIIIFVIIKKKIELKKKSGRYFNKKSIFEVEI